MGDFNICSAATKQLKIFQSARSKEITGHSSKVHVIAWNCTGSLLATGSTDNTAKIWQFSDDQSANASEIKEHITLYGHSDSVDQLAWSPKDPQLFATVSLDKTLRLWNALSGELVGKVEVLEECINISFSPTGNQIAVGTKEETIHFIDVSSLSILHSVKSLVEVNEFGWNSSQTLFLYATGQGNIVVLDAKSFEKHQEPFYAHLASCYCLKYDPNGRFFATGGADSIVAVWEAETFVCCQTITSHSTPIRAVGFSFDGMFLASGSEDSHIDIRSVLNPSNAFQLVIGTGLAVNSISWHPKKHLMAFAAASEETEEMSVKVFGFVCE